MSKMKHIFLCLLTIWTSLVNFLLISFQMNFLTLHHTTTHLSRLCLILNEVSEKDEVGEIQQNVEVNYNTLYHSRAKFLKWRFSLA